MEDNQLNDTSAANNDMPPLQIFLLSFTCISMIVYIIVISTISVHRKQSMFRGSFFSLVMAYFVADFFFFLEFTILMRGRKYGWLNGIFTEDNPLFTIVPPISNAFHYYIKIVIYIGQVLFAFNRLSSSYKPLSYEKFWTNKMIWTCRIVQFTLPLFAVLPLSPAFNSKYWVRYVVYEHQNTLRLETDPDSTELIAYVDAGCSFTANILSFIMYAFTLKLLRNHSRKSSSRSVTRSLEIRFLCSALIIFFVLTLNTVLQIATIIANTYDLQDVMFVNDLSYPLIDLMYSCQPWALLLTSSVLRRYVLNFFKYTSFCKPQPENRGTSVMLTRSLPSSK